MSHIASILLMAVSSHLTAAAVQPSPAERAAAIRAHLEHTFVDAKTGVLYTRVKHGSALEDCSLYGGFYLGALVAAWKVEPSDETAALARKVLAGLMLNASMGEPGLIARGVAGDARRFLGKPSVDQYTGFLYGLYEFHQSGIATRDEKERIQAVFRHVLRRLKRDGYQILTADRGAVTKFGRLASITPTRSERLLSFLLAGAKLTGDQQWWDEYESARRPRMKSLAGFERFASWVLIQTAASLRMLCDLEERPEVLRVYRAACREAADRCLTQIGAYQRFVDDPRAADAKLMDRKFALRTVRIPIEAVTVVLLVGEPDQAARVVEPLRNMLTTLPVEAHWYSVPLVSLEWAYWLARERGMARGVRSLQRIQRDNE